VVAIDEVHSTSESRAYITVCSWGRVVELRQKTHSLHGASYKDHRRSEQMCKFFASHLASLPLSSSRQSMWLVSWLSMFLLRGKMVLCESISAKLGKSPKEWQEALRPLLPSSCIPLWRIQNPIPPARQPTFHCNPLRALNVAEGFWVTRYHASRSSAAEMSWTRQRWHPGLHKGDQGDVETMRVAATS
jgi:hypothetical protein